MPGSGMSSPDLGVELDPPLSAEVREDTKSITPTPEDEVVQVEETEERAPSTTPEPEITKNTAEIPTDVSVTTDEDPNEEVDTTVLLVRMGKKREKKMSRIRRRAEREQFLEDAKAAGKELVTRQEKLDRIAKQKEEDEKNARLAALKAEEENKELTIDEKIAIERKKREIEDEKRKAEEDAKKKAEGDAEDPEEEKKDEAPVDSVALLRMMMNKKKSPEELEKERKRKEENERIEEEAKKRALESLKKQEEDMKKAREEKAKAEKKARGEETESEEDESEEESEEDEAKQKEDEKKESTDEELLTEDQKLKRRLKKRAKESKSEQRAPNTPKPDRSSAAGLQESIKNQLMAAHEEEMWLEQEFEDLAKAAKKKREEQAAREVAEIERLKTLPPEERELIERAKRVDQGLQDSDGDRNDYNDENDPLGIKRQLRKRAKKSSLKKISAIGTAGMEGTGFQSASINEKKVKGVRFAADVKKDSSDEDDSDVPRDEDISDMEGSEYTDTEAETTDGESSGGEETDDGSSYESGSSDSDDLKEREQLTDEVFSSKLIESKKLVSAPGIPLHSESEARVVFKLRDPDAHAMAALRREFKDCPEVQISCGDYFKDAPASDAMVIPLTNAFGFMDQPPELQYSERFSAGGLQERLRATIVAEEDGELLVGDGVTLIAGKNIKALDTIDPELNGGKMVRYVICVPIMRVPMFIQDTCNAYMTMRAIIRQIKRHNMLAGSNLPPITSVSIPALCAGGFARMPPARIARQMKMAYDQWVLEKFPSLSLAQDLGELATVHIGMATFKTGHQV